MKIVAKLPESIRVASSYYANVDLNRCYHDRDYFLFHFGECTGLMPHPKTDGEVSPQWDFANVVTWFFDFITSEFLEPTWNGLTSGSASGFNFIFSNMLPSSITVLGNALLSALDPLVEVGKYLTRGLAVGTVNGIQGTIGPLTNAISLGMKSGIFDLFGTLTNSWTGQENTVGGIVQQVINQLGRIPQLAVNIGDSFTQFIPVAFTNVADHIKTILKSDYRNTPSCETLKYALFDNPVVPFVYGTFPELGPAALTFFKATCYTSYTDGFFQNFSYPIATWGIPWAQPTTPLPTVKMATMPSPQEVVDFLKSITLQKIMDGIANMKIFQNAFSYLQSTVPIHTGHSPEHITPQEEHLIHDLQEQVISVGQRVRRKFQHCTSKDDCCTLEEIITGKC